MTSDQAGKIIPLLVPIAGSVIQAWTTLLKRSNWTRNAQTSLNGMGWPFFLFDRLPLCLSYFFLFSVFGISILGLIGGGLIIDPLKEPPSQLLSPLIEFSKQIFHNSIWLVIAYVILAVSIQINAFPKLFLVASYLVSPFFKSLTFHPGWINASWHAFREDDATPVNTIRSSCESVANDVVQAWASRGQADYEQHRATKPLGFSKEELANFLLVSNAIESAIHQLPQSEQVQFGALYDRLGSVDASLFAPATLRDCNRSGQSLYAKLREQIPDLPDRPLIGATITNLVRNLASRYWGRAYSLAQGWLFTGFDVGNLDLRLRRTPGFTNSQAMRAQVIKLAVDMDVWEGMDAGPFIYPFSKKLSQFLLNLDCIRTSPSVRSIGIDDSFIRLSAWTVDRIVDAVDRLLKTTTDTRLVQFCKTAFASDPKAVPRWVLSREVDYFLWAQSRDVVTEGGIFGERAAKPWLIEGESFIKS
jgi:hypothetical protein